MPPHEITVSPSTPMQKGYGFLRKGNPYLTALCRRKTHAAKKTLYIVSDKSKPLGLRAPKWILREVFEEERLTRSERRTTVQKRDVADQKSFLAAVQHQFPNIPSSDADLIVKKTLKKRSGRVGRTGKLDLKTKVKLAVVAHTRHCHTKYDEMMRGGQSRDAARKAVQSTVLKVMRQWGAQNKNKGASEPMEGTKDRHSRKKRKATAQNARATSVISLISSDGDAADSCVEDAELEDLSDILTIETTEDEDDDDCNDENHDDNDDCNEEEEEEEEDEDDVIWIDSDSE